MRLLRWSDLKDITGTWWYTQMPTPRRFHWRWVQPTICSTFFGMAPASFTRLLRHYKPLRQSPVACLHGNRVGKANEGHFEKNDKKPCFDNLWLSFLQSCHASIFTGKEKQGDMWHWWWRQTSPGHLLFLLGVWSRKYPFCALLLSHGSCLPKLEAQGTRDKMLRATKSMMIRASHKQKIHRRAMSNFFFQMVYFIGWEIMDRIELIRLFNLFILRVLLNWSALRSSEGWTCCGILHQGQSMGHWEWLISKSGWFVFANFVQEMPPMRPYYHYIW